MPSGREPTKRDESGRFGGRASPNPRDPRFEAIRRSIIRAIAADDDLSSILVLKGGNALRLVHKLGTRTSLDVDYSLEGDFPDVSRAQMRLKHALVDEFQTQNLRVIDFRFEPRPPTKGGNAIEGYRVVFKLITNEQMDRRLRRADRASAEAEVVGPGQLRTMQIEISKQEYCGATERREFDGFRVLVSEPRLILVEKFRALCQQLPGYTRRQKKSQRARDFYDIHSIVTTLRIDCGATALHELAQHVFAAKRVSLELLPQLGGSREFHRPGWVEVENTVSEDLMPFDDYFDFVVHHANRLQPLRPIDAP